MNDDEPFKEATILINITEMVKISKELHKWQHEIKLSEKLIMFRYSFSLSVGRLALKQMAKCT